MFGNTVEADAYEGDAKPAKAGRAGVSFLGSGVEVDARDEGDAKPAKKGRAGMSFLGRGAEAVQTDGDGDGDGDGDETLSQLDATQPKPTEDLTITGCPVTKD